MAEKTFFGLTENTIENLIIILIGVVLFNVIVGFPGISKAFEYPMSIWTTIVILILLIKKDVIARKIVGKK